MNLATDPDILFRFVKECAQPCIPNAEFEAAREHFSNGRYDASLNAIHSLIGTPRPAPERSAYQHDDVLLLTAWNYLELRELRHCRVVLDFYYRRYRDRRPDPRSVLIEQWLGFYDARYASVIAKADEWIKRFVRELDPLVGNFLFLRGSAYECLGRYDCALDDYETAQAVFKLVGMRKDQGEACLYCAIMMIVKSRYGDAENWLNKSKEIFRDLGLMWRFGHGCLNLGIAFYKSGLYEKAAAELTTARRLLSAAGDELNLCRTDLAWGNVLRLQRRFPEARNTLQASLQLAGRRKWVREECIALEFLGAVDFDDGKLATADRYFTRCLDVAGALEHPGDLTASILRRQGDVDVVRKRYASAIEALTRARSLSRTLGDGNENGLVLRCLSDCMVGIGDLQAARRYCEEAIAEFEKTGSGHKLGIAHLRAAGILLEQSNLKHDEDRVIPLCDKAWLHALSAHAHFVRLDLDDWLEQSQQLLTRIGQRRLQEARYRQRTAADRQHFDPEQDIVAVSEPMREVLRICDAFAPYDEPVLVTGATGTGKEVIARRIHEKSSRQGKSFVPVNVTAITDSMFEREFFGHRKGAFSGAEKDVPGYAALAHGGTLFLDEIGDMPRQAQPKLLRLLQDGTYTPLGHPGQEQTDIRLVAATNSDLRQRVADGRFREDLYFRLRILEINIPPLTERVDDIVPLLDHFLSLAVGRSVRATDYFNEPSIETLLGHSWPGNVREVAMVASRANISMKATGKVYVEIGCEPDSPAATGPDLAAHAAAGAATSSELTRSRLVLALDEAAGNRSEAARRLGISRATLYRRLRRFNIT